VTQLLPSVRAEVEKPFSEKLARTRQLIRLGLMAHDKACVSCSFGKDSLLILWFVRQEFPDIQVIFNNTGVEFSETLALKEQLKTSWNLNLIETKPIKSYWNVMNDLIKEGKPIPDGRKKSDRCCDYLKEIPFRKVLKENGFTVNFTGITAVESRIRMFLACQRGQEYFNRKDNVTKIHPILYWTPQEVWSFTKENNIPINLAYQKYNIDRIGCVPCTSHKLWREQLAKVNPRLYKLIQERYFHQKLLEV
jgi:phosphoadenosine phosphosulfate reductase